MRIGISGAHRSGKTTLAKALAEKLGCELILMDFSDIFQSRGIKTGDILSIPQQIVIQSEILGKFGLLTRGKKAFVTDRTPLDMIAYMQSFLSPNAIENMTDLDKEAVHSYIKLCRMVAGNMLDLNIITPSNFEAVEDKSKYSGYMDKLYIDHVENLIRGEAVNGAYPVNVVGIKHVDITFEEKLEGVFEIIQNITLKEQKSSRPPCQ